MHYISLWEMAEIGRLTNKRVKVRKDLRGYAMQAVPPDRRSESLSVSELASTRCSTHRDIYLAKVARVKPSRQDRTWEAEAGTIIHSLLQEIHRCARRILSGQEVILNAKTLFRRLKTYGTRCKSRLLAPYKNDPRFIGKIWSDLDQHVDNIIFFETILICSLLTYKASRKTVLATGANISPLQEFEQLFNFSAIEQKLSPAFLGLTQPITPDFIYADRIIGDIKTGKFDEDAFLMTCVAYALAYEAEYRRNIDFGIILHVEFSPKHSFPIYQGSRIYEIDTGVRRKFTYLRDKKLDVLVQRVEPPIQQDEPRCRPCRFYSQCWER